MGARPEAAPADGETPLHVAAFLGYVEIIEVTFTYSRLLCHIIGLSTGSVESRRQCRFSAEKRNDSGLQSRS